MLFLSYAKEDSEAGRRLPGDHVTCCAAGGRVSLDGKVLDEDYVSSGPSMPDSVVPFNVIVPLTWCSS
jgi:hypothetical protein